MKRCVRCIMPDTAKGITLDALGICPLCHAYREVEPRGEDALRQEILPFVKDIAGENCIVPVSGGRDSAYALYYVKKVLGLKPLAVHNDNDFESEIAKKNLEAITSSIQVPLVRVQSKRQLHRKVVAEKYKMNAPFGPGRIVEQTCEACKYGFESGSYNIARQRGIKVIFWGDSNDESTTPYHSLFDHEEPSRLRRLLSPSVVHLLKYKYYFGRMKKEYGSDSPLGLKEIHLYDYVRWDQRVIVDTIQRELGWSVPEEAVTTWRVDCTLVPLVNFLSEKAYGVSKLEIGFSNMVRAGKMDREDALQKTALVKKNTDINQLRQFLRELGISPQLLE